MTDVPAPAGRSSRLDQVLTSLLSTAPELEAAAVVSFDGLPMASALPAGMDEDRVAAMSAALLSLGDRAAQGLGRGDLSQVYVEGEHGTVFLVSADDEAVLVAVASRSAKIGMMLFEVRRAAQAVAAALVADDLEAGIDPYAPLAQQTAPAPTGAVHDFPAQVGAPAAVAPAQSGPAYAMPDYSTEHPAEPPAQVGTVEQQVSEYAPDYVSVYADQGTSQAPAQAAPQQVGGPVMVPASPITSTQLTPTIADTVAPDGLAWPQLPVTEPGWG